MVNYHSGRVKDPDKFLKGKKYWATITLKNTEGIELVTGKLEKDGPAGPMTAQAYRFPTDKYTEKEAKDWLKKRKIKTILFEPAEESTKEEEAMITTTANIVPSFDDYWDRVNKKKKRPGVVNEQEVIASSSRGEYGGFVGGYHWRENLIRDALREAKKYGEWQEIFEVFDDRVYIGAYDSMTSNQRYFEIEYEIDEEEEIVYLGDATEIEKKTEWIIKEQAERAKKGLFEDKKKFRCECLDCGHIMESEKHCRDIKCPECGGQMRRAERPGPGQKAISEALTGTNDLPDSSFGFIEPGGEKDEEGLTTPRKLRHYPMKDAQGNWSKGNVVNALTRLNQATKAKSPWLTDAAKKKILSMIKSGYKALELEFPEE